MASERSGVHVVEIGGRARSGIERKSFYHGLRHTSMDILAGPGVDVVGDAHNVSQLFPPHSVDGIASSSVWEHLAMPWKVSLELNKIMRVGGIGWIATHQTLGLHDFPWDFYRFSKYTWTTLFNAYTGFEIIEAQHHTPVHIIPQGIASSEWWFERMSERSSGFMVSEVLFRKVSDVETGLSWDVPTESAASGMYPGGENGHRCKYVAADMKHMCKYSKG